MTKEKVSICGYDGRSTVRNMAEVEYVVGHVKFSGKVAVVEDRELGCKALIALSLRNRVKLDTILDLLENECTVNAVETRAMAKTRCENEKRDVQDLTEEKVKE